MAAHLRKRGSQWYLVDGEVRRSLKTDKKVLAEARLRQYVRQEFRFGARITVKGYYEKWIKTKEPPVVRKSTLADYKQQFSGYLLSEFGSTSLATIDVGRLCAFRSKLLERGLSVKTC